MLVSVIIPTYNRAVDVINALNSLILQDFDKFQYEVIVVDNDSSDNTTDNIKSFIEHHAGQLNIKYAIEKRRGDVYARHTGAAHAEGKILAFTDDDATFDSNWISEISRMFNENPEMGALGTSILIKWDKEPEAWVKNFEHFLGKIRYKKEAFVLKSSLFINNGALAITKEAFYKVGGNNPGQIGSFLIGDAEIGLCHKLHEAKIPIGFTNRTTMWHHQKAGINGTKKDLLRRSHNNGISKAYSDIHYNNGGSRFALIKSIILRLCLIIKDIITNDQIKRLNTRFQLKEDVSHLTWLYKMRHDKEYLKMQAKKDWVFNANFIPGKLIYQDIYARTRTN